MKNRGWLLFAAVSLCVCAPAFAQSTFGTFLGTVQDQTGSIIPDATVTAKNVDTTFTRTTTSNSAGQYQFPNMQPGNYSLTAEKAGFATAKVESVTLDARQQRRI